MQPLSVWRPPQGLVGVFTDIDDTLTTEGAITPDALQAHLASQTQVWAQIIAQAGIKAE